MRKSAREEAGRRGLFAAAQGCKRNPDSCLVFWSPAAPASPPCSSKLRVRSGASGAARPGAPSAVGGGEHDAVQAGGRPTAVAPPWAAAPLGSRPPEPTSSGAGGTLRPGAGRGVGAAQSLPQQPRARSSLSAATRRLPRTDRTKIATNACDSRGPSLDAHSGSLARSLASPLPSCRGGGRKRPGEGGGGWG